MFFLCGLFACDKAGDVRGFFKAQPVDERTALTVDTIPAIGPNLPGSIDIDGQRVSNKTPHTQKPITPGKHQVRIEAQGYISMEFEAVVEEGKDNRLAPTLSPRVAAAPTGKTGVVEKEKSAKRSKKKKGDKDDPVQEEDTDANVHSSKTMIVTAAPSQNATLDGTPMGTASGLRVEVTKATGDLRMGSDSDEQSLTFNYANKAGHVRIKPKDLGQRSILVDGHVPKNPWIDIDTRARRIEVVNVEGKKQTYLMKVIE